MRPMTSEEIKKNFGEFTYEEDIGGWIKITDDFERQNLTVVQLPCIDTPKLVHKKVVFALNRAFHIIETAAQFNPDFEYIKDIQIFAPRHIRNDVKRPLSSHSYGIAFDINPSENMPNCDNPTIPTVVVRVFERMGFFWGGLWNEYKDYMHFEPRWDFFTFEKKW